jgi:hypothetical protein
MIDDTVLHHIPAETVFQLDDAVPQFSCHICPFLDREFSVFCIARGSQIPWPPDSPGLIFLDIFFWRFVEDIVGQENA